MMENALNQAFDAFKIEAESILETAKVLDREEMRKAAANDPFSPAVDADEDEEYDEDEEIDALTVNGWAMDQLGGIPEEGDAFSAYGLSVTVLTMDGRRIEKNGGGKQV